ncbi:NACHT domain-containing protein [Ruegeria arenilitoris]|uniref:NACHT domain-containing protein n=1 Tax=Ruegeria arenilitoris TaxID=1173585 RepID=UPI0014819B0E|nr:NACHT domain-containing protein [Ruegeria arenilitoris]
MATKPNLKVKPGDALRDQAAKLLSSKFGPAKTERREMGKKPDIYFEVSHFGRTVRLYVEAKDYGHALKRSEVAQIFADYSGILDRKKPASLLIVTRNGLSTDADTYVNVEQSDLRHQTILEIEVSSVDLSSYMDFLQREFAESRLDKCYVESDFRIKGDAQSDSEFERTTKGLFDTQKSAYHALKDWVNDDTDYSPVALLGGYGSGKTSLATKLAAELAEASTKSLSVRRPIFIKLGNITRYSAIDGILGGLFTSEVPIQNFNFHDFQILNDKGHFLIILDGFDEMKHSMTWTSFKAQVQSLLKLHKPKSKVLLLGRPSAFLSEDEERHILKGERRFGDDWVSLPHWPRFHELELSDFNAEQRKRFVTGYLALETDDKFTSDMASERASVANKIADSDPKLFGKPVHSKILTDLATDPKFDLSVFSESKSRWVLYKEFIRTLYTRELEKEVRQEISDDERIKFLRDLAFWLWTEKGTSISFSLDELPGKYFSRWEDRTSDDKTGLQRELLSGSILERKQSDVYYFGHRSFAEFLVADRMLANPPAPSDHAVYSQAYTDGVQLFLSEASSKNQTTDWCNTFSPAKGAIHHHYINFLIDQSGSIKNFKSLIDPNSPWSKILEPYSPTLGVSTWNFITVLNAMWGANAVSYAWHFLDIVSEPEGAIDHLCQDVGFSYTNLKQELLVALLNSLFKKAIRKDRYFTIESSDVGLRRLAQRGISTTESENGLVFGFSSLEMAEICMRILSEASLPWMGPTEFVEFKVDYLSTRICGRLEQDLRENLRVFSKHSKSFSAITEVKRKSQFKAKRDRKSRSNSASLKKGGRK